jgi:type I restriction enzyme S subunit
MRQQNKFKETEIGNIPEEWEVKELENLGIVLTGKGTKKLEIGKYPIIGSNGLLGYTEDYLEDEDLIFTGRVGTIGRINFQKKEKIWLSDNVLYFKTKNIHLLNYVYYYLKKTDFSHLNVGSTQPLVKQSDFKKIKIALPQTENELIKIAKILSDLDSKIELNCQMDKTLEEIGQALFKHWFIDFEFPNEKGKPYKSSGGEMADSELGEIPKEWEVKNLGEIIELGYGKGLRENRRKNGVYPVVGSSGIVGFHDEYLVQGPGIVIGRKGTIGEVIWVNSNFFPIDTTFYVASKIGKVDLYYFYYLLLTQDFPRIGSDSAVPGLNRNFAYMNLKPAPPVDLINKFNHICKSLFEMMALKKEEISVLGRVCDSLLPKLMSGQIRVPAE